MNPIIGERKGEGEGGREGEKEKKNEKREGERERGLKSVKFSNPRLPAKPNQILTRLPQLPTSSKQHFRAKNVPTTKTAVASIKSLGHD